MKSALLLNLWSLNRMECDPEEPMSSVHAPNRDWKQVSSYCVLSFFHPEVFSSMSSENELHLSVLHLQQREQESPKCLMHLLQLQGIVQQLFSAP